MITLLRSTFLQAPTDDPELFLRNAFALTESGLGFTVQEDTVIWKYITGFIKAHGHVPSIESLRNNFTALGEMEVLDRLDNISHPAPLTKGDFLVRLEAKAEERRIRTMGNMLKEAETILKTGMEIKEGRKSRHLKGPIDAYYHLMDNSSQVITPMMGSRISGEVGAASAAVDERYEKVKNDPRAGIGQMCGIQQIDEKLFGAQRHELWIHAAFTGNLKSIFLVNWLYTQAIFYQNSSLMFSLEMPFDQCNMMFYAMHSFHEKFQGVRHALGLQPRPDDDWGLDYMRIKFGLLSPAEEELFRKHVIPDFGDPRNNYGKIHIEVADPSRPSTTIEDIQRVSERLYSKSPFSMIAVDHVSLMDSRGKYNSTTERLNEVCRDLKMLALYFNRGLGIPVVGLFQMSREGYKNAKKIKEKTGVALYDLTALSYANEAERSADKVTTTFVDDELMSRNRVRFQCLKSRDLEGFKTFLARVEYPCRRILTCFDADPTGPIVPGGAGGGAGTSTSPPMDDLDQA